LSRLVDVKGGTILGVSSLIMFGLVIGLAIIWFLLSVFTDQFVSEFSFIIPLLIVEYTYHLVFSTTILETLLSLYLIMIITVVVLDQFGAILAFINNILILVIFYDLRTLELGFQSLIFLIITIYIVAIIKKYKEQDNNIRDLNSNLSNQVKELKVLRNISTILQGTLELNKVLHIILSAVTAGYGLEFNRAMLFLVEDGELEGEMAIGPLNKEEGLQIWQRVAQDKLNLDDMIEITEEVEDLDENLNDIITKLSFSLEEKNIITEIINEQESHIVEEIDKLDSFQRKLSNKIQLKEFIIVPLVVKGKTIGVLCADNIANGRKITYDDIDSLLPFANQAALAIESTRLYKLKERMAIRDNLTDLYNQRYFEQSLEEKVKQARETGENLGLLIADIDYFKAYNDNNGHPAGNTALTKLAKILQDSFRDDDIVCRFGGEEFAIILPNVSIEELVKVANRICNRVEETYFENQDQQPNNNFTISIGGSIFPNGTTKEDELLSYADTALYYAKDTGRNTVELYKDYISNKKEGENNG
jgi:diguanylate cyclase (GGDEF)-like protein